MNTNNQKKDILFIHVPKSNSFYKPITEITYIVYPPVGLFGLADYAVKNNFSAAIVSLHVEQIKEGRVDLEKIIADYTPRVIGLDLHWHFQSFEVIRVAKLIKKIDPAIHLLLGGFTASYFADEILKNYPEIDTIIRGDAEIPLIELLRCVASGSPTNSVQNLSYRNKGQVIHNSITYIAESEMLDKLDFTNFSLMRNFPTFVSASMWLTINDVSLMMNKLIFGRRKSYPIFLGRGCPNCCSFCGGSKYAQVEINNRSQVSMRSAASVVKSLSDVERAGFDFAFFNYDPLPQDEAEKFYISVFNLMRENSVHLNIEIERWGSLPSREFMQSFKQSLGPDSFITLSLNTPSEELRRKNNMYFYSNQELEDCLNTMQEVGVKCLLCFMCGLPFEEEKDLVTLVNYQKKLKKRFPHFRLKTAMVQIEPGSAMSKLPESYEVINHLSTFQDYYNYHAQNEINHYHSLGYERAKCPDNLFLSKYYCRHLCSRFKLGWASRIMCNISFLFWKIGVFSFADRLLSLMGRIKPKNSKNKRFTSFRSKGQPNS